MRGGMLALAALLAAVPSVLGAAPPESSLRPKARAAAAVDGLVEASALVPLALPTVPPPALAVAAPLAQDPAFRPKPRPGSRATAAPGGVTLAAMKRRPQARPAGAGRLAEIEQVAAVASVLAVPVAIRPLARPQDLPQATRPETVAFVPRQPKEAFTGRKGAVCGDAEIKGSTIPPIAAAVKGCGLSDGVRITSVAGVKLTTPAEIDCTTAKALKSWVKQSAIPAVGKRGGGLAALQVAASYACRPRNNQKGAKVSEHGRGRAIDIGGYILANGTSVSVLKGWGSGAYGATLAAMRKSACGPFNTVLGPGSDSHHRDHLHLDTARGRGPYCR